MEKIYLTAREAAAELNVSRATLYAYVSRGMLRSEPSENARGRLYRADDVRGLRERKTPSGGREQIARSALSFGAPVLDSAITLIADGRFYYRGRDAIELARFARFEQVATLLWQQADSDPFAAPPPPLVPPADLAPLPRALAALAMAGQADLKSFDLSAAGVARTGADIVRLLTAAFADRPTSARPVHEQLAEVWEVGRCEADLLRAALVLVADHELNVSAFTVRCVASTMATPHGCIAAGLNALQGPRHGGQTARVLAFLDEVAAAGTPETAVMARLRRGDSLPGFGHPLYPDGDPRATALLAALGEMLPGDPELALAETIGATARDALGAAPNIDFALATLARALRLPDEAPFALFAIGRAAGWLAHVQEQYAARELIRPRARYVGPEPQVAHPGVANRH